MTRAQGERIIREWQARLGLELWDVEILWDEPAGEGDNARTWRSNWYDNARVYFDAEWPKWSRERFEQTAIHELLHLLHRGVDQSWNELDGQLHRDAWTVADNRYMHEMEGFIDRLASRLLEAAGPA